MKENKITKLFNFTNIIILIFVLMVAFIWYTTSNKSESLDTQSTAINLDDHTLGDTNSKVIVYEYADIQCPACAAFESIIKDRLTEHPEIQFIWRHFPLLQLHQNAMNAAIAVEAASRQGKFWELKALLYTNQTEWSGSLKGQDIIRKYAQQLGLDMNKYDTDIADPLIEKRIQRDIISGTRVNISGTPSFFLNGNKLDNSIVADKDAFAKAIQEAGNNNK